MNNGTKDVPKLVNEQVYPKNTKSLLGTTGSGSAHFSPPTELATMENCKEELQLFSPSNSTGESARGLDDSSINCRILPHETDHTSSKGDSVDDSAEISNTAETDQASKRTRGMLFSEDSPFGSLYYEPPQLEDFGSLFKAYSPILHAYSSDVVRSPAGYLTPPCGFKKGSVQLSAESILKSAAMSYPNTPSIIRRRKRETQTPLPLDSNTQTNERKDQDSACSPIGRESGSNQEVFKESTSHSSEGKSINITPPYRLRSKRTSMIKSVEKQLDFNLKDDFDGSAKFQSLASQNSSAINTISSTDFSSMQGMALNEHPVGLEDLAKDFALTTNLGVA